METEDVEVMEGTPAEATAQADSQNLETLAQETDAPGSAPEGAEKAQAPLFDPNEEQVIEFNGKTYSVKGGELQNILENVNKLAEKEKSLNRDYTQKTQALAEQRKSIESAFGRMPDPEEIQNLGQVWKAYFQNEQFKQIVDSVLSGQPIDSIVPSQAQGKSNASPEVSALQNEIRQLKGQLSQFVSGTEREKQEAAYNEGKRVFDTWRDAKQKSGSSIPEELVNSIIETASILRRRNPSWDVNKALDEALKRETVDDLGKEQTKKALQKADQAKKGSIKISPKSPSKSVKDTSYKEIFQSAM